MEPFNFVQFRIPAGKLSSVFEKSFDAERVLKNVPFMLALKEAAPEFFEIVNSNTISDSEVKTLYKYFSRWCTRSTPFGQFSGVFSAQLSEDTVFHQLSPKVYKEPDIIEKSFITDDLNKTKIKQAVFFYNSSLYRSGESWFMLQYSKKSYSQIALQHFEAFEAVIKAAEYGVTYQGLENIIKEYGYQSDEVIEFILELLQEQVIYTNFTFRQSEIMGDYLHRHKGLDITTKMHKNYTFMVYPDAKIAKNIIGDIISGVNLLRGMFKVEPNSRLEWFKKEFLRRYEGTEVPLLELLDPEFGISYGDYNLNQTGEILQALLPEPQKNQKAGELNEILLNKYIRCMADGRNEIKLTKHDFDQSHPDINTTAYIFGNILAGGTFFLKQVGGSSAVNLMSRFSLGNPDLANKLREITALEQSKTDAILAEVIHLPEGKIGNVVLHAPLRDYILPYLGSDDGKVIPLKDLRVSISGNQVIIRSVKYNRRVIPYLSHAYNYTRGLPVYCFLGDLQPTGAQFAFDWGVLRNREFLPRVTFGKLILSRATWNLSTGNYQRLFEKMPRHLVIVEGDNELYIDKEQAIGQEILNDYLKKNKTICVQEFLYTPENCFVKNRVSEVVIPVTDNNGSDTIKEVVLASPKINGADPLREQISYPPGSQWLYFKLYTGHKTADKLLKEKIKSFVALLREKGLIEKWFFIRYHDPDFHLRLRFYHSSNADFYKTIIELFHSYFKNIFHKIQIDTYHPEYDRYPDLDEAERVFELDSDSVLDRLDANDELQRIETSLKTINSMMHPLSPQERVNFCLTQRDLFLGEFGWELKSELNKKYRIHSSWISNILKADMESTFNIQRKTSLPSYIHMHVNRNFISDARRYEMLLYHFLYRYYESFSARKNLDLKRKN